MYRVPWVCSPAYSLHKYILIAYSVPGSVGDTGNLMRAKQIPPLLSCAGRRVWDIIWIMTHIYMWLQRWLMPWRKLLRLLRTYNMRTWHLKWDQKKNKIDSRLHFLKQTNKQTNKNLLSKCFPKSIPRDAQQNVPKAILNSINLLNVSFYFLTFTWKNKDTLPKM